MPAVTGAELCPATPPQGLVEREKLASSSELQVAAWRQEQAGLESPLAAQEARVAALLAKKETAEAAEREAIQKAAPVAEAAPTDGAAGDAAGQAAAEEAVPADETDEERGRRIARQWTNDVRCLSRAPSCSFPALTPPLPLFPARGPGCSCRPHAAGRVRREPQPGGGGGRAPGCGRPPR